MDGRCRKCDGIGFIESAEVVEVEIPTTTKTITVSDAVKSQLDKDIQKRPLEVQVAVRAAQKYMASYAIQRKAEHATFIEASNKSRRKKS